MSHHGPRHSNLLRALVAGLVCLAGRPAGAVTLRVNDTADTLSSDGDACRATYLPWSQRKCSLRTAIRRANALPGSDTIIVPAGFYRLTRGGADEDEAELGDLDITESVTLVGEGSGVTVVDGAGLDRVFDIWACDVRIRGITIQHGQAPGGAGIRVNRRDIGVRSRPDPLTRAPVITFRGCLTLESAVVRANVATVSSDGAGILNDGLLDLKSVILAGNQGAIRGGGLASTTGLVGGRVGALLEHVTVVDNAAHSGGGIDNGKGAWMEIRDSDIRQNAATQSSGGGVANAGRLHVVDTVIGLNTAAIFGGGVYSTVADGVPSSFTMLGGKLAQNTAPQGGGLASSGDATLDGVVVFGNVATGGGGGGILSYGTLAIRNGELAGNRAAASGGATVSGGGIECLGVAEIRDTAILDNEADHGGGLSIGSDGQATLTNVGVASNRAVHPTGSGGGIHSSGQLALTGGSVALNRAQSGGGITATALLMTATTVRNNTAVQLGGGVLHMGGLLLSGIFDSTISANIASKGGGVYSQARLATLNTTISGNTAADSGGGLYSAIGEVVFTNTTVTANGAPVGGGVFISPFATARLKNTIVARNLGPDCYTFGGLVSEGQNLAGDASCGFAASGDLNGVDPDLGPLANNGGPTFTHALTFGSPAIDAGDDSRCPATDQRGVIRPQGAACDIGAFEAFLFVLPAPKPSER